MFEHAAMQMTPAPAVPGRVSDVLCVIVPNTLMLGVLHLTDVSVALQVLDGLLMVSFTIWRWRRVLKSDKTKKDL
jgi:hypothetical protein